MQVILKEDVPGLGTAGSVVNVKDGYARNYLIPQNLALLATPKNVKQLEHQKRLVAARMAKLRKAAASAAEKLAGYACTVARHAGDNDRLFGSVTAKDIVAALQNDGIDVARRQVVLDRPFKQLGIYQVEIRHSADICSRIHVWVTAR